MTHSLGRSSETSTRALIPQLLRLLAVSRFGLAGWVALVAASSLSAQDPGEAYRLGKGFYDMGLYARAIPHFEEVRDGKAEPELLEQSLFLLGECYYVEKKLPSAGARYLELIRKFPETSHRRDALLRAGESLVKVGEYQEASSVLDKLLSDPGEGEAAALYWAAEAQVRLENSERAETYYQRLVDQHAESEFFPYSAYNLAGMRQRAGRAGEAIATLERVDLSKAPETLREPIHLLSGDLHLALGQSDSALQAYDRVTGAERRPLALEGIARAANLAGDTGRIQSARQEAYSKYRESPERLRIDLILAAVIAETGRVEEVDALLEDHVADTKNEATFWRAWSRGVANRHDEAIAFFEYLAETDASTQWSNWALYRLSFEKRAIYDWEGALKASTDFISRYPEDSKSVEMAAARVECLFQLDRDAEVIEAKVAFVEKYPDHELTGQVTRFAGESAIRLENWPVAIQSFETLLAGTDSATARLAIWPRLAWSLFQAKPAESAARLQSFFDEAQAAYAIALSSGEAVDPSLVAEVGRVLGFAYRQSQHPEGAVVALDTAQGLDAEGEEGALCELELASLLVALNRPVDEVAPRFQSVLKRSQIPTTRARAELELGELFAAAGRHQEATEPLRSFVKNNPVSETWGYGVLALAFCEWRLGTFDQAEATLAKLFGWEPLPEYPDVRSEAIFLAGQVAKSQELLEPSEGYFTRYLEEHPNGSRRAEVIRELARLAEAKGDPEAARGWLAKLYSEHGEDPQADEALYRLAWLESEAGETDKAKNLFTELLTRYPESSFVGDTQYRLAEIAYAAGDYELARSHYQKALESADADRLGPFVTYRIAWSHRREENWELALASFRKVSTDYPEAPVSSESIFLASEAARELERAQEERALLEAFLGQADQHAYQREAKIRYAELLTGDAEWQQIKQLLEPVETDDLSTPLKARRSVALGRALLKLGAARSALSHFESALAAGELVAAEAHFEMGNAHVELGDLERAISTYLSGTIRFPYKPWATRSAIEAGRQSIALGKTAEAKRILTNAYNQDPESAWGREAKKLLDSIEG